MNVDVKFYAIAINNQVKYLIELLDKTINSNGRALVLLKDQEMLDSYNKSLWTSHTWLPHCVLGNKWEDENSIVLAIAKEHEDFQVKDGTFLFIIDDAPTPIISNMEKIFVIFNKNNANILKINRQRWKDFNNMKLDDWQMTIFNQDQSGKFVEK